MIAIKSIFFVGNYFFWENYGNFYFMPVDEKYSDRCQIMTVNNLKNFTSKQNMKYSLECEYTVSIRVGRTRVIHDK